MKKIITVLIVLIFIACSNETTLVEGVVLDENRQPIDEVLIQVMGTDLFEYSDSSGSFKIDTKSRGEELIFNKDGYQFERRFLNDVEEVVLKSKN